MNQKAAGKIVTLILAILVAATLSACNNESDQSDRGGGVAGPVPDKPSPNLIYVDPITSIQLGDSTGGVYTYDYVGEPPAIIPGNILASGEGPGYLRKVTSVNDTGTSLEVGTTQAALNEAFENLDIHFTRTLTPDQLTSSMVLSQGVSMQPSGPDPKWAQQFTLNIKDKVVYDRDGDNDTTYDQVVLNGSITFSPIHDFDILISNAKLDYFRFVATMTQTAKLSLSSEIQLIDFKKEIELAKYHFSSDISHLPLVFTPVLTLSVKLEGKVSANISTEITQTATVVEGVKFENQNWELINAFSNSFEFAPPAVHYECSAKASAGLKLSLIINGVVGPYVSGDAYLLLKADPFTTPWWNLYGGLEAKAGIKIEVLSNVLVSQEWTLFSTETLLASAPAVCIDADGDRSFTDPACGSKVDCNEADPTVYPDAPEICDGKDNQCPGDVGYGELEEGIDLDGDGYKSFGCSPGGVDCDDHDPNVHPGKLELCDYQDNQCPGDPGFNAIDENCEAAMVMILPGCFEMGNANGYWWEQKVHPVCIDSEFYMDIYEVSNSEYYDCVQAGVCSAPHGINSARRALYWGWFIYNDFPVINISWRDAKAYCNWVGKRLPTEAEWEYAARGGREGDKYPWGKDIGCGDANYGRDDESGVCWDTTRKENNDTHRVDYHNTNGYGLKNMAGNVSEYVFDYFSDSYYSNSPLNDPAGPYPYCPYDFKQSSHVIRGGSFKDSDIYLNVASRKYFDQDLYANYIGFRCAKSGASLHCQDSDGDSYFAPSGCGTVPDCDDSDGNVHPGQPEIGDFKDNQCPEDGTSAGKGYGVIDEGCFDIDGDGRFNNSGCGTEVDCNEHNRNIYPRAPELKDCIDNQCPGDLGYGLIDEIFSNDADGDGFYFCSATPDCNDDDSNIYPGAPELCDHKDNQCPGDEGYGERDEGCVAGMAPIPAGCFLMGNSQVGCTGDACPAHDVCMSSFYMDLHEVTNADIKACVTAKACTGVPQLVKSWTRPNYYDSGLYPDYPALWINSYQAIEYCAWWGKRLPTEAEWEYAARGGLVSKKYPNGDSITCADANFARGDTTFLCYNKLGKDNDTHMVGSYAPNGYGLFDMDGNVREWVNDWYSDTYYSISPVNDPQGPATGTTRVFRGGDWIWDGNYVYTRNNVNPSWGVEKNIGFRCVRTH